MLPTKRKLYRVQYIASQSKLENPVSLMPLVCKDRFKITGRLYMSGTKTLIIPSKRLVRCPGVNSLQAGRPISNGGITEIASRMPAA